MKRRSDHTLKIGIVECQNALICKPCLCFGYYKIGGGYLGETDIDNNKDAFKAALTFILNVINWCKRYLHTFFLCQP